MDREDRIQAILNGDITDDSFLRSTLATSLEEEDDLVRGMARCFLQEKSLTIIGRLLKQ